ncbi:MAG: IS3 family transposase [Vulcanimicrobiaceae bacterium]
MRALCERGISKVRACDLIGYNRSNLYYRRRATNDAPIETRLKELARERPRWGWRRLLIMIRRDRIVVGETRFRRIYRALELQVRPRRKRKINYVRGNFIEPVSRPNERWSIDFMHDRIENGRSIRALAIIDDLTRECLSLYIDYSLGSADVIREFEGIAFERGLPETIRFDNGAEFTSHAMLRWGAERDIRLHFIAPGKPTQNGSIESLNGKIRDELLNMHRFTTIFEARRRAEAWRTDYNQVRPHSALGYRTPKEFAEAFKISENSRLSAA